MQFSQNILSDRIYEPSGTLLIIHPQSPPLSFSTIFLNKYCEAQVGGSFHISLSCLGNICVSGGGNICTTRKSSNVWQTGLVGRCLHIHPYTQFKMSWENVIQLHGGSGWAGPWESFQEKSFIRFRRSGCRSRSSRRSRRREAYLYSVLHIFTLTSSIATRGSVWIPWKRFAKCLKHGMVSPQGGNCCPVSTLSRFIF